MLHNLQEVFLKEAKRLQKLAESKMLLKNQVPASHCLSTLRTHRVTRCMGVSCVAAIRPCAMGTASGSPTPLTPHHGSRLSQSCGDAVF